jgi:hypothetical protein
MADADARPRTAMPTPMAAAPRMAMATCTPAANLCSMLADHLDQLERRFEERIEQVKQNSQALIVEQQQWIEAGVQEPLRGLQELWDRVAMLMRRMSDLKEYLGFQGSAQPIILFNGQDSEWVTRVGRGLVRGETIEHMPNPEANAAADAGVMERMESMEEIEIGEEGGKHQDVEEEVAIPPMFKPKANANANGDAKDMEGIESKEEVDLRLLKEQVEAQSAILKEGPCGPEHANANAMDGAVPPIQIILATPQDSQEMVQWPMIVAPPLSPLLTPPSVYEAVAATMAMAMAPAVTAASPALAVTSIPSPHPSPPHTQVHRSP